MNAKNRITGRCQFSFRPAVVLWLACLACFVNAPSAHADDLRVLPDGKLPDDRRLETPKDLNGYFPFEVPASKKAWEVRAAQLRRRVLVATGLWPMPEKTPLNPVIHGRVERDGFTVEKVYFESVPNHFVTGLLFRPTEPKGKPPVVLCPHGHGGRLQDHGKNIQKLIDQGQERFADCGRYPKLSRCAQLARMGCVVLIYDMLGYADSVQITRGLAHGFSKQRPEFDTKESWGLFSTQAELRMQSVFGLQTWNSIRCLDFLCSLPGVDTQRVGVTGGSGGGTQTIILCAIDPRPVVAFPQGMVSTSMQGGCTCENCCLLRVGTGNVELAALFAPKPQAMTAANDWTKAMMTKGYPELQRLYGMLGVKDQVQCTEQLHFPHNYNYVTRGLMYGWFNKYLKLGLEEPIVEEHWRPLTPEDWTVWDDEHPQPEGGAEYERSLCKWLDEQSKCQINSLEPKDSTSLKRYRDTVHSAFDTILGHCLADVGEVDLLELDRKNMGEFVLSKNMLEVTSTGALVPVLRLNSPKTSDYDTVVVWVSGRGKAGMFDANGKPRAAVQRLLDKGVGVFAADLLYQGEFLDGDEPFQQTPVVSNRREYAGYTFGYNHTVFAQRVHDILAMIDRIPQCVNVTTENDFAAKICLVGVDGAGPLAAAALAQAGDAVHKAAIDTGGFRFVDLNSYRDPNFLPGAVKYGDLPALLALAAPRPLWIAGEDGGTPDLVTSCYSAAGQPQGVTSFSGKNEDVPLAAVEWLLAD
jgi:dienelactone hydrolase